MRPLGGLNDGLFSASYHSGTASAVNKPAIVPKPKGNASDANSLKICDLFIKNSFKINFILFYF